VNPQNEMTSTLVNAAVALMGSAGRLGTVRVLGESMKPTVPPGSVLCVDFAPGELSRGDLLVFRQASYLAVHRLLGRATTPDGRPCLRTRGDCALALDPPVDRQSVIGRAVAVRRDGTWRDLNRRGARAYAALLALHDLGWAAAGVVADRTADRFLRALRLPLSLRGGVARTDAALLRAVDRLFFRVVHPPAPLPPGIGTEP
jgi:hypothetical protein